MKFVALAQIVFAELRFIVLQVGHCAWVNLDLDVSYTSGVCIDHWP